MIWTVLQKLLDVVKSMVLGRGMVHGILLVHEKSLAKVWVP